MAIIKAPKQKKERLVDKTITLEMDLWKELTAYAKFAGIGGKPADKQNYIIAEALKNVFEKDSEYQASKKEQPKTEAPKAEEKPAMKPPAMSGKK